MKRIFLMKSKNNCKIALNSLHLYNRSLNSETIKEILNSTHSNINQISYKRVNPNLSTNLNIPNTSLKNELIDSARTYNKTFQNSKKHSLNQNVSFNPNIIEIDISTITNKERKNTNYFD